jgi:hypothetical protein
MRPARNPPQKSDRSPKIMSTMPSLTWTLLPITPELAWSMDLRGGAIPIAKQRTFKTTYAIAEITVPAMTACQLMMMP